jgi:hypothetical protein
LLSALKVSEPVEISIETLLDVILYYGPKSFMQFGFGFGEDYELRSFHDENDNLNKYWNSLLMMIDHNQLFSTFGKEMTERQ